MRQSILEWFHIKAPFHINRKLINLWAAPKLLDQSFFVSTQSFFFLHELNQEVKKIMRVGKRERWREKEGKGGEGKSRKRKVRGREGTEYMAF